MELRVAADSHGRRRLGEHLEGASPGATERHPRVAAEIECTETAITNGKGAGDGGTVIDDDAAKGGAIVAVPRGGAVGDQHTIPADRHDGAGAKLLHAMIAGIGHIDMPAVIRCHRVRGIELPIGAAACSPLG